MGKCIGTTPQRGCQLGKNRGRATSATPFATPSTPLRCRGKQRTQATATIVTLLGKTIIHRTQAPTRRAQVILRVHLWRGRSGEPQSFSRAIHSTITLKTAAARAYPTTVKAIVTATAATILPLGVATYCPIQSLSRVQRPSEAPVPPVWT